MVCSFKIGFFPPYVCPILLANGGLFIQPKNKVQFFFFNRASRDCWTGLKRGTFKDTWLEIFFLKKEIRKQKNTGNRKTRASNSPQIIPETISLMLYLFISIKWLYHGTESGCLSFFPWSVLPIFSQPRAANFLFFFLLGHTFASLPIFVKFTFKTEKAKSKKKQQNNVLGESAKSLELQSYTFAHKDKHSLLRTEWGTC